MVVPDTALMNCEHPERGPVFHFRGQQCAPTVPQCSQPSGNSISDTSAYLLRLMALTPPVGQDPHSKAKQQLLSPSLYSRWDQSYQSAINWWENEALNSKPSLFPSGHSPNFSCRILDAATISLVGDFASTPVLAKSATPSDLQAPSSDCIKFDFSAHRKVADIASVQNLLLILEQAAKLFKEKPLRIYQEPWDIQKCWNLFQQLLAAATWTLQPLQMDALVTACRAQVKVCTDMSRDVPAQLRQELMVFSLLSVQPLDHTQAAQTLWVAP